MASPWLLLAILLLLPLFFIFLRKKQNSQTKTKNHPPGPPPLPFIGNLHQLGVLPHQSLCQLSKKYGPVMLIKLGRVPTVIISSSEAAKDLFKNHDLSSCSRPSLTGTGKLSYNYLDIAFTPYGDYWREMRKICVLELFSAKRVQSFKSVREEEVSLLIESISSSISSSGSCFSPVDMSEKLLILTCNITCRVAFGTSFQESGLGQERFQEVIHEGLAMLGSFCFADLFPYYLGWIGDKISGLHGRLERNFQEFDGFYQKIIDDHIQKDGRKDQEQEDIIDVLLGLEKSQRENFGSAFQFSKDHIKAILMNIFLAGVDTGAITLVWAMAELIRNPRVMKKAQQEIRTSINKDKTIVSETDIENLEYLKMVVKETLRLHPPGTLLIPRETMSQFSLNGHEIYPKTRIQVNVWAIGKDPNIWRNPNEFCPERFSANPNFDFKGDSYEMLPFGGGRRGCPGITMGLATVELALANLLFCFDWKLGDGMKIEDLNMEEAPGLTVYKKEPLLLVPIKYQLPA
ncbi:cytochrome P450 71B10-like [Mercurialis annua]|uniref:cytochrome P450 71B10-like n=1 Tax=Mercurialis annua TaxID=3986 RepID=UPI00215E9972|nr:cytochrome P450 71B10-like [Mercurialis annua]